MTDEERALDISRMAIVCVGGHTAFEQSLMRAFAAIRADEREKCAQVAGKHDTGDMQREDMEARRIAASIRSGRFAAAIRERGKE